MQCMCIDARNHFIIHALIILAASASYAVAGCHGVIGAGAFVRIADRGYWPPGGAGACVRVASWWRCLARKANQRAIRE